MSHRFGPTAAFVATLTSLLSLAGTAAAAAPGNDARTAAQALGPLPAVVDGTAVDATAEADEPCSGCGPIKGSVWFSFRATQSRDLLIALDAAGDMDAVVELFARERSQLTNVACAVTNRRGQATLDGTAVARTSYLVRVAPLSNSVADRFTLRVALPDEPARPPGDRLAAGGVTGRVDRFANPDDAWATQMTAGRTYRINLVTVGAGCVRAELFAPGGWEFGDVAQKSLACDAFTVFTPSESGRYSLRVQAPRASRASWQYRLRVGPAGRDDSSPGLVLADDKRVAGALHGDELDALDLYRFTVARRSDLRLRLRTGADFELKLMTDGGHRIGSWRGAGELVRRLRPGRYFVAVRARDGARGRYVLSRLARVITHSRTLVNGARGATVSPGQLGRAHVARDAGGARPSDAGRRALRPARRLAVPCSLQRTRERHPDDGAIRAAFCRPLARHGILRGHASVEPERRRHRAVQGPRAAHGLTH